MQQAKFSIGQVVKHKLFPFRGVVFDVDPFEVVHTVTFDAREAVRRVAETKDFHEGVKAFIEKRPPEWSAS